MYLCKIFVLVLLIGLWGAQYNSSALAAGHHHHHHHHDSSDLHQDEAHLEQLLEKIENELQKQNPSVIIVGDAFEKLAFHHLIEHLDDLPPLKMKDRVRAFGIKFTKTILNPIRLGTWLVRSVKSVALTGSNLFVKYGTTMAVAYLMAEITETFVLGMSLKYPALIAWAPAAALHLGDAAFFALWFGVPKFLRQIDLWITFKGGPWALARFFSEQRKEYPVDWDVCLSVLNFTEENQNSFEIRLIEKSWWERLLTNSPSLQKIFSPKKYSLKQGAFTFSIDELEELAKKNLISIERFERAKSSSRVYGILILTELIKRNIFSEQQSATALNSSSYQTIEERMSLNDIANEVQFLASERLDYFSALNSLDKHTVRVDLLANVMLWKVEKRILEIESELESKPKMIAWKYNGLLRKVRSRAKSMESLTGASLYRNGSDAQNTFKLKFVFAESYELLSQLERIYGLQGCEKALSR